MTAAAENPESEGDLILAPDERAQDRTDETLCMNLNDLELSKPSHATKQPSIKKDAQK